MRQLEIQYQSLLALFLKTDETNTDYDSTFTLLEIIGKTWWFVTCGIQVVFLAFDSSYRFSGFIKIKLQDFSISSQLLESGSQERWHIYCSLVRVHVSRCLHGTILWYRRRNRARANLNAMATNVQFTFSHEDIR